MVENGVKLLTCEYSRTIKTYLVVHDKSRHLVLDYMTTSLVVLTLRLPRVVHTAPGRLCLRDPGPKPRPCSTPSVRITYSDTRSCRSFTDSMQYVGLGGL